MHWWSKCLLFLCRNNIIKTTKNSPMKPHFLDVLFSEGLEGSSDIPQKYYYKLLFYNNEIISRKTIGLNVFCSTGRYVFSLSVATYKTSTIVMHSIRTCSEQSSTI